MTKKERQQLKSDYQYCYGEYIRIIKSKKKEVIEREKEFIGGYHRAVCTMLNAGHRQNYGIEIAQEWEEEVQKEWKKAEQEGRAPKRYW